MAYIHCNYKSQAVQRAATHYDIGDKTTDKAWPVFRPRTLAPVYGDAFHAEADSKKANFDDETIHLCLEGCRTIEILEDMLRKKADLSSYFYCLSQLTTFGTQAAVLCAKFASTSSLNECVGIAAQLGFTLALCNPHGQKLSATTQAGRVMRALQTLHIPPVRKQDLDLFVWILSVLCILAYEYQDKDKTLDLLFQTLCGIFGTKTWPNRWEERLLAALKQFVWSEIQFAEYFDITYCELRRPHSHGMPRDNRAF